MMDIPHHRVAIVGCGLIGDSWAALMTAYGYDVAIWSPEQPTLADKADRYAAMRAQVRATMAHPNRQEGSLHFADSLDEALAGATWVQENAPENLALKAELYQTIEAASAPDVPIASSTSSLTWSELAPALANSARLLTAHPFNPPHLIPLVEIYTPDSALQQTAQRFFASLERETVFLKRDAAGHIANRLASALWREAVHIVAEDIADVADVDRALVHGPGLRWSVVGAHMAYHLGGGDGGIAAYLQHLGPSQERRWATLGDPSLTDEVCAKLVDGIAEEAQGASMADLCARRDALLIAIARMRATIDG